MMIMRHWDYRVVRKNVYMGKTISPEVQYAIYETYYNDEGEPTMITTDYMSPYGETPEELKSDLEKMVAALDKPVLNWGDFKNKEIEVPTNDKVIGGGDRQ